ncbi:MAG: ISL3 family transposase [Thermoleophilaceae bacterium]
MRVTTAFNRMLAIPGGSVRSVWVESEGVVVALRLRRRRLVCGRCGCLARGCYDRRRRRWRHLDLGGRRCWLEYELRRFSCPGCGRVVSEAVPWARPGARHTRAFDQLVACLAQRMAKAPLAELLRISWTTVGRIIERSIEDVVSERRFDGLRRIGIDEVSFRRGHRYLTLVVDHDRGRIVWASEGARAKESLDGFLEALGGERAARIEAISIDMAPGYYQALRERLPQAALCIDPFHVVRLANHALNLVRRHEWNRQGRSRTRTGRWLMGARWALVTAPERQSERQRNLLVELEQANHTLYSAYLLKEQLRALYRLPDPEQAPRLFDLWLDSARTSGLAAFERLADSLTRFRDSILAAIQLGLSNGRLEGINAKVRLLSHRSFGFHSAKPLIALVYLCCGGIQLAPPLR